MNAPARYEIIVLPDGVKKVAYKSDTKIPNAATFTLQREDHTLGNVITARLLQNSKVIFAAYRMPHPLNPWIEIKIQTTPDTTPQKALSEAFHDLIAAANKLAIQFDQEFTRKNTAAQGGVQW